jgi:hypothetical protein
MCFVGDLGQPLKQVLHNSGDEVDQLAERVLVPTSIKIR